MTQHNDRHNIQRSQQHALTAIKAIKQELLAVASGAEPDPAMVARTQPVDLFIQQYLTLKFNAFARTRLHASLDDSVFVIHADAESAAPGAAITKEQVVTILDKYGARLAAPGRAAS
ncbi:MAG TPA: hypothetical protein VEF76_03625 [Patescibacteria group bacterium]|nr:hypothetical protein [Patescibacteria group bacterium]